MKEMICPIPGDCHIHMLLDGGYYRDAMNRHKTAPDLAWVRQKLRTYAEKNITYIRDGGDAWGVGLAASVLAEEYGITYRTPVANICREGHYGCFLGWSFKDLTEYRMLIGKVKTMGGHFVKIMISGIMDFHTWGVVTDTACSRELCCDMISAAHDEGLSVMVHANGNEAVSFALWAGADSIEHGAYLNRETLCQLSESHAVWVPTIAPIARLCGTGRFPDRVLIPLTQLQQENVAYAASHGAKIALGTDAGASHVYHETAAEQEYELLRQCLGGKADSILLQGLEEIKNRF